MALRLITPKDRVLESMYEIAPNVREINTTLESSFCQRPQEYQRTFVLSEVTLRTRLSSQKNRMTLMQYHPRPFWHNLTTLVHMSFNQISLQSSLAPFGMIHYDLVRTFVLLFFTSERPSGIEAGTWVKKSCNPLSSYLMCWCNLQMKWKC